MNTKEGAYRVYVELGVLYPGAEDVKLAIASFRISKASAMNCPITIGGVSVKRLLLSVFLLMTNLVLKL